MSRDKREKPIKIGSDFKSTPLGVRDLRRNVVGEDEINERLERHIVEGKKLRARENIAYSSKLEAIRKEVSNCVESKGITKEQVIEEISLIAFNRSGLCSSLEITTRDKLKALDMLSKWLGLYERDNAQKASQNALLQVAFVGNEALSNEVKSVLERESLLEDSIWNDESMPKLESKTMDKLRGKSK